MLNWLKRRPSPEHPHTAPVEEPAHRLVAPAKSAPLYKYLNERYADAVVLTFAEVEDLLGFSLPALARLSESWWTSPAHDDARLADSWILASRTARPNLPALTVAFERVP